MRIVELNSSEFSNFTKNHPLRNYCQTIEYAKVMSSYIEKHDNVIQENGISEWNNKINLIKID